MLMYFCDLFSFFKKNKNKNRKNTTLCEPTLFASDICNLAWRKLQKLGNLFVLNYVPGLQRQKHLQNLLSCHFMTINCHILKETLNKHYYLRWNPQITIAHCSLKSKKEKKAKQILFTKLYPVHPAPHSHKAQNPMYLVSQKTAETHHSPSFFPFQVRADKQNLKIRFTLIPIAKSRTSIKLHFPHLWS